MYHGQSIGVAIPALNEAPSIGTVIERISALPGAPVDTIVVCDNGSTDATAAVARAAGADVVQEPRRGYGRACDRAVEALQHCDCIVFMDGDNAMDPAEIPLLLDAWRSGADLVIGSRALGQADPGSLTHLQSAGNWFAGKVLSRAYATTVTDLGPYRAIAPKTLKYLDLNAPTYSWTVAMQAHALARGLRVVEVPVSNAVRVGESKVSGTWRGRLGASVGILGGLAKAIVQSKRRPRERLRPNAPTARTRSSAAASDKIKMAETTASVR